MTDETHEKAIDLTEKALEKLNEGNEKEADKLIEQAKSLDPSAPKEVVEDMEEDAKTRGES